ncbi:hypothetical protein AAHA92_27425 [Salvia divinorum]|uniref:Uncharacterized protein n=1 Tax=Salvia divinorum TaxID=28513 RepID=A0ABD1G3M0_SALDI
MLWAEDFYYNEGSEQAENQFCWNLREFTQFSDNFWKSVIISTINGVLVEPAVVENYLSLLTGSHLVDGCDDYRSVI